ncbi:polyketide synthase docking domain-containing protein [Thermocrispum municipale]
MLTFPGALRRSLADVRRLRRRLS